TPTPTPVLVEEPHVVLHKKEKAEFSSNFAAVAPSGTLPLSDFPKLLAKHGINLSKGDYIRLVDSVLPHAMQHLSLPPPTPSTALDEHGAQHVFCKVYAAPVFHGPRLRKAAGRADHDIVRDLVMRGCDINTADGNGHTPLHTAAFLGMKDTVKELAAISGKNGAAKLVVDAKDNSGWTPLMCAASNGHVDVVKALLDLNADARTTNKEGRNALHVACSKGMDRVVKLLLGSAAGKDCREHECERGWTPIYDASLHAHAEVLAVMLKAGARTDGRDMLGYGPDHYCAKEGLWEKVTAK
ncbi:hypothetical protein TeGR_g6225, partial [Tetraparma gracilis]